MLRCVPLPLPDFDSIVVISWEFGSSMKQRTYLTAPARDVARRAAPLRILHAALDVALAQRGALAAKRNVLHPTPPGGALHAGWICSFHLPRPLRRARRPCRRRGGYRASSG